NVLDGGTGADRMFGGTGDDTYIVDNVGDVVVEFDFEPGTDVVLSFVSFKIAGTIERVELQGTDNIGARGNNAANTLIGN
ncbi:calcium-binding protein, partial [Alphaproteobacteria bacterium]|nr:calcium-binding protein [Alphaproteobacteria bacterium]